MPMPREEHETLLALLLDPSIETSVRTETLQKLRVDYSAVITDDEKFKADTAKLQADNTDLVLSNSKLFRQLGTVGGNDEDKRKEEEKTLSETITLEQLEK